MESAISTVPLLMGLRVLLSFSSLHPLRWLRGSVPWLVVFLFPASIALLPGQCATAGAVVADFAELLCIWSVCLLYWKSIRGSLLKRLAKAACLQGL